MAFTLATRHYDASQYRSEAGHISDQCVGGVAPVSRDERGVVLSDWDGGVFLGIQ